MAAQLPAYGLSIWEHGGTRRSTPPALGFQRRRTQGQGAPRKEPHHQMEPDLNEKLSFFDYSGHVSLRLAYGY